MRVLFIVMISCLSFQSQAFDLYLVRHFEKLSVGNDPELTSQGKDRAQQFANLMDGIHVEQVYSTDYNRTRMTATPVANAKKLQISIYDPRNLASLAEQLKRNKHNAIVVGHSNTTPKLIELLGGKAKPIAENEFGELFILSINEQVEQKSMVVPLSF